MTRRAEPAARWVRPRGGRGRAGAVSLPISALPAERRQNWRRAEPAARRDRPHRRRGRAGYARTQAAGGRVGRRGTQNRRQAGIGRTGNAGGGAHETRTDKTRRRAARRVTRRTKPAARRVRPRGGRGRALYPCQYPPFPRSAGKNWRRAEPAARRDRPHGGRGRRRAGRRGTQNRRQAGISRAGDAGGRAQEKTGGRQG